MTKRMNRDPWALLNKVPTSRGQAKYKAHLTMVIWLPVFRTLVERIQRYESTSPNWLFHTDPVAGPIYGGSVYVRACQKIRGGPDLQLLVSVWENSRVSLRVGGEELYATDCLQPCNDCQEELEEAILLRFGI